MNAETVELHFIDGSQAGTRKQMLYSDLIQTPYYVVYTPIRSAIDYATVKNNVHTLQCTREVYRYKPLDEKYGIKRFVLYLDFVGA